MWHLTWNTRTAEHGPTFTWALYPGLDELISEPFDPWEDDGPSFTINCHHEPLQAPWPPPDTPSKMAATLAFNLKRRHIYLLSSTVAKRISVARPLNIDTRSRKWYIIYYTCSLSLLTSHILDLPQTAMVLTPICVEGLGVGLLVFSAYREPTLVNYPQSNAPSPFKSNSTHKISAESLAVEIWVHACPLPNGRRRKHC